MAADDVDAEQRRAAHAMPVEHGLGVLAVGLHEHVDEAERPAAHRPHVGHVRDDRRGAGGVRVGVHERRTDRLAAHDQVPVAVRDRRRVVAVDRGGEPA